MNGISVGKPNHRRHFFKHFYAGNPNEWGCIAFPKSQTPTRALMNYKVGDLVFLAITQKPELYMERYASLAGKIFAVCSLHKLDGMVENIGNPELIDRHPDFVSRWPSATPIDEYWSFETPMDYVNIPDQPFLDVLSKRRGQLIDLNDFPEAKENLTGFLASATLQTQKVYKSRKTRDFVKRLPETLRA
jgi:hypothetical protein